MNISRRKILAASCHAVLINTANSYAAHKADEHVESENIVTSSFSWLGANERFSESIKTYYLESYISGMAAVAGEAKASDRVVTLDITNFQFAIALLTTIDKKPIGTSRLFEIRSLTVTIKPRPCFSAAAVQASPKYIRSIHDLLKQLDEFSELKEEGLKTFDKEIREDHPLTAVAVSDSVFLGGWGRNERVREGKYNHVKIAQISFKLPTQ